MVIIDTSLLIDHLRQSAAGATILTKTVEQSMLEEMAISVISLQELYAGQSAKDWRRLQDMEALIGPLRVLAYTDKVAQKAGELMRDTQGGRLTFADAAIAATAVVYGGTVATLNKRDFVWVVALWNG